jgi:predicted small metal-binding protein
MREIFEHLKKMLQHLDIFIFQNRIENLKRRIDDKQMAVHNLRLYL